jgi:hypothetical protein
MRPSRRLASRLKGPFPRALGCRVLTNNSHAPPLKQRPFHSHTRSLRNDLRYHHSEVFRSPLLFEDIMESSSGKLQELPLYSREGGSQESSHCTHLWGSLAMTPTPGTGPLKFIPAKVLAKGVSSHPGPSRSGAMALQRDMADGRTRRDLRGFSCTGRPVTSHTRHSSQLHPD